MNFIAAPQRAVDLALIRATLLEAVQTHFPLIPGNRINHCFVPRSSS